MNEFILVITFWSYKKIKSFTPLYNLVMYKVRSLLQIKFKNIIPVVFKQIAKEY